MTIVKEQPAAGTEASGRNGGPMLTSVKFSLNLSTLAEIREFCGVMAKTEMVPKAYRGKPDDILVSVLHGQELGLPALQALQSIAVINGVPSIYGDAALALVRSSGKLEDFDEWLEVDGQRIDGPVDVVDLADKQGKKIVAYCVSKRLGSLKPRKTWFSVDDAKRAHLWLKKGYEGKETPWCTVPQRMLMWRARGWNLRDNFGDVLKGLAIYEEAQDFDLDMQRGADGTYQAPSPSAPVGGAPSPTEASQEKGNALLKKLEFGKPAATATPPPSDAPGSPAAEPEPAPATTEAPPTQVPAASGALPAPDGAALDHEARQLVSTFTASAKGTAILKGVRKDFKLAPAEVVPTDVLQLPLFIGTLKQHLGKL
jgi:hypothetical protein